MAEQIPRTILCLGNPGPQYSSTRHNVAWWLADRVAERYDLGRFRQQGNAGVARGRIAGVAAQVIKPLTFMILTGRVLHGVARVDGFDLGRDLLVVVDEMALEPGRSRLRASGSPGGHNGLKSVQGALGTQDYARLRIGVGAPPPGWDRAAYVLSSPTKADRQLILDRIDDLVDCIEEWVVSGTEVAMNICNN